MPDTQQSDPIMLFIVDDNPDVRSSVAMLASAMDIRCETFASAEDFLDSGNFVLPACSVFDLRLPGMGGLRLLEKVRGQNVMYPVVILSAYLDVDLAVRCMQAGAATVVEKPYRANDLWDAISNGLICAKQMRVKEREMESVRERLSSLTDSERRTLQSLLTSGSNKKTAHDLQLSLRTIDLRRKAILEKLSCQTIVGAAQLVVQAEAGGIAVFEAEASIR